MTDETDDKDPGDKGAGPAADNVLKFTDAQKKKGNGKGRAKRPDKSTFKAGADGFVRGAEGQILKGHPGNIRLAICMLGVELKHNDFSNQIEINGLLGFIGELTDPAAIRLRFLIGETYKFIPSDDIFERVLIDMAYQHRYHPVREFLDGLVWDGVEKLDTFLIEYAGAMDTAFHRAIGRHFFIAGVRRVRQPGCKFDTLMVWESPQGKDKSQAARIIAIREEWFTDNLPLGATSKEVIEQISGVWIAEFADLTGMSERTSERLKTFLSRQVDRARPAYGRRRETVPRQFVGIGNTNDHQYLIDDENRRYWPAPIIKFNLDKLRRDIEQIWAEAARYEARGDTIVLDESLWEEAADIQKERKVENPYTDLLREVYANRNGWVLTTAVWVTLNIPLENRFRESFRVGQAMREIGFKLGRVKRQGDPRGPRDTRYYWRGSEDTQIKKDDPNAKTEDEEMPY